MSKKRKAVFLDRDGTLIHYRKAVKDPLHIILYRDTAHAIKLLNQKGYFCVVITNQPSVEKGLITRKEADALNQFMVKRLKTQGAQLDAAYLCPHCHPSTCECRKPNIGMIKKAVKDLKIDLKGSWLIGDGLRDIETGKRAKLNTILVKTRKVNPDDIFFKAIPDFIVSDLMSAARLIVR